jgi:hypothetical protein
MLQDPNSGYYYWWNDRLQEATWENPNPQQVQQQEQQQQVQQEQQQQQGEQVQQQPQPEQQQQPEQPQPEQQQPEQPPPGLNAVQQWLSNALALRDTNTAVHACDDMTFDECYEMLLPQHGIAPAAQFMFLGIKDTSDVQVILSALSKMQPQTTPPQQTADTNATTTTTNATTSSSTPLPPTTPTTSTTPDTPHVQDQMHRLEQALSASTAKATQCRKESTEWEQKYHTLHQQLNHQHANEQRALKAEHATQLGRMAHQLDEATYQLEQEQRLRTAAEEHLQLANRRLAQQQQEAATHAKDTNKTNHTSRLRKELDHQRARLKTRRAKMDEDEKVAMARSFVVNQEMLTLREQLDQEQHQLAQAQVNMQQLESDFEERCHHFEKEKNDYDEKLLRNVGGGGTVLSPISGGEGSGGEGRERRVHTPAMLMFSGANRTSLGSVIRIPDRDADVSQEADDLLTVLDRLIAETKGAMVEGLTPTRGGNRGEEEEGGGPTSPSSTDLSTPSSADLSTGASSRYSETNLVEDPRGRIMQNVAPVLVRRDGQKTTEDHHQQQPQPQHQHQHQQPQQQQQQQHRRHHQQQQQQPQQHPQQQPQNPKTPKPRWIFK